MTLCSMKVPAPCRNAATEILHFREHQWSERWEEYPRCDEHPAADDIPMIMRMSPLAETRIEKVQ